MKKTILTAFLLMTSLVCFSQETSCFMSFVESKHFIPVIVFICCVILCPLLIWLKNKPAKRYIEEHPGSVKSRFLEALLSTPIIVALIIVVSYFTLKGLPFVEKYEPAVTTAYYAVFALNLVWFVVVLVHTLLDSAYARSKTYNDGKHAIDINVIRTIKKISSFFIWFVGIIWVLNILGVDIAALVTTLGIGGVAIALAAQETVKNVIGGLTILTDQTLRIGDRIVALNIDGFVEDIGLRTTKVRLLDNRIVSIPNSKLVDAEITNVTSEPTRKVVCRVGVTYDTTPEKMKEALNILKDIANSKKDLKNECVAAFEDFGDSSLNIMFAYFIKSPRSADYFKIVSEVNLEILTRFNAAGLDFAFPTRTVIVQDNSQNS